MRPVNKKDPLDDYYTPKEAAKILGLKYPTLMARIRKGKILHQRIGWSVLIPKSEVDFRDTPNPVERSTR